jgi:hypothetical protein
MSDLDPLRAWGWCAALVLVTITIHVIGIVVVYRALRSLDQSADAKRVFLDSIAGEVSIIVGVALALALLHGVESLIWAIVYVRLGAVSSLSDAILYSLGSMTTRGSAGLHLQTNWLIVGAVESGDGMLLFGISTAFLFAVMSRIWRNTSRRPWF